MRQETFERIFKEHLKIETYSKSIDSLFGPRLKSKINYKPYYQRNYVWDNNKATYFIESILLGTEVPPLIFFDNNTDIEIIDGRQRFETIMRYMEGRFSLTAKGLNALKQLKRFSYNDLSNKERDIIDNFVDSKLRIIEFKLVNEPPLDKYLEDRIKKEIFSRYNSGITPLRKSEIDNAIYDEDDLSNAFKSVLENDSELRFKIYNIFCLYRNSEADDPPIETIMSFVRKSLMLPLFPINYYARGTDRTDISSKLYEEISDASVDAEREVIDEFIRKVNIIIDINNISQKNGLKINRLASECFMWALGILEQEDLDLNIDNVLKYDIAQFIHTNIDFYTMQDYAFQSQVIKRYAKTASFFVEKFNYDFAIYVNADDKGRERIKEIRRPDDAITRLSELETLRLNKPEPSRNSIDDVVRTMNRRRFLVRPSYQRKEVINPSKSSAIIESILLGITLPPIFVYKRNDGVSEVIDGQQRVLTLLGFLGQEYIDEKGVSTLSKNHKFTLRNLRILRELNGKSFEDLNEEQKNKIYDFQLYVVEIDEKQNPNFNPIDLFIRLNDKPFPIREHSFEMWNSWVDIDIINEVKNLVGDVKEWFYLRLIKSSNDRDRMENEELIMSLAYIDYMKSYNLKVKTLDVYQKSDRINVRLNNKANISNTLLEVAEEKDDVKKRFIASVKSVRSFVKKVKYVLLDCDKTSEELNQYLRSEMDSMMLGGRQSKYARRTRQDFYILWDLLSGIGMEMIKYHRIDIKKDIKDIIVHMKNIPEDMYLNNRGLERFLEKSNLFKETYRSKKRRVKLSEEEKKDMISKQGNKSGISGAPIFLGDEIEVDHTTPLAIGGEDKVDNLNISHKDENRSKGSRNKSMEP